MKTFRNHRRTPIAPGQIVALVGGPGTGKTTLAEALAGRLVTREGGRWPWLPAVQVDPMMSPADVAEVLARTASGTYVVIDGCYPPDAALWSLAAANKGARVILTAESEAEIVTLHALADVTVLHPSETTAA